ncbi:MAG: TerC family protein [Methanomassiliicoccaceae archaeon]|nr:TerC family protein [Methanomassiliicoccaceae archaeon]
MMIDDGTMWIVFIIIVAFLLFLDLGVINRKNKDMSMRKALALSAFWISVGSSFGILVYLVYGPGIAADYYASYLVEEMMSVDNLFVFIIIFAYFRVPDEYQHKALFMGILGAFAFRLIFIVAGIRLLERFDLMMYVFGAVLIFTALRTVMKKDDEDGSLDNNVIVRWCRKFMNVADDHDGGRFFTVKNGVKMATPLLLAVIVLELTDVVFAFDSIPAVLAITTNTFIVYSSNVFAILGLRSIYFALRGAVSSLAYLKYGLGAILAFIGVKMLISHHYHIGTPISLAVIIMILAVTVILSVTLTGRKRTACT